VSTGTDIPAKNRFSSGILLLKTVNDVLCRATDSRCPISSRSLLLGDAVPDGGPRLIDQHPWSCSLCPSRRGETRVCPKRA